jgi:hypothetical protein
MFSTEVSPLTTRCLKIRKEIGTCSAVCIDIQPPYYGFVVMAIMMLLFSAYNLSAPGWTELYKPAVLLPFDLHLHTSFVEGGIIKYNCPRDLCLAKEHPHPQLHPKIR